MASSFPGNATSRPVLPPALDGVRRETFGRAGRLSFYVAGEGEPLLLVHSINAAGSAYEVKPIFDALVKSRRVYAVDLPGFGFSDRSKRNYTPRLFTDALTDMLGVIAEDEASDKPIDALAISLGAEFLARAAVEHPDRFRTLALVTPTGFNKGSEKLHGKPGETRQIPGLYGFFTFPLWSQGIYDLLVSKPSIRYFLRKTFGSENYDRGLAEYDYLTTHQLGAKNAPFAFVSGKLFSKDIRSIYERLMLPVWMPHGTRGDFADFREAVWAEARTNWLVEPFDTGALPHFEQPQQFMASYERFLANADVKASAA
jgi:pimeloyl-ACP methyl ester carboxylesterase